MKVGTLLILLGCIAVSVVGFSLGGRPAAKLGFVTRLRPTRAPLVLSLSSNSDAINSATGRQNAWGSLRRFAVNCGKALRKFVAVAALILSLVGGRVRTGAVAGAAGGLFASPIVAHAGVLRRYTKLNPMEKLATTPLFFVTNSGGSPYLQEDVQAGKPSQRIVVYFMSSEDANDYMNEMAQGSPQNVNEFRIKATSLEKVMNNIQKRKQSRKLGRYQIGTIFRIQPSSRQCDNAERIAGGGNAAAGAKAIKGMAIPMFTAKGLAIQRSTGELMTPYYFAYEDLQEDWANIVKENQEAASEAGGAKATVLPTSPKVVVKDFTEVMCLSRGITTESLNPKADVSKSDSDLTEEQVRTRITLESVGVVPPRREISMLRGFYRNQMGLKNEFAQAKIIGAPR